MHKVLAIDDKPDNLTTISALLKNVIDDCDVITALSAAEGIEKAKQLAPDTILLDVIMPEMNGFRACQILKADPETRNIPIIMLTAIKTDAQSRIKGLKLGADAFLAKPIDPGELAAQVNVMLRIKKAEDIIRREKELLEDVVKERTRDLQQSEERYRSLVETMNDGLAIVDPCVNIQYVNEKFCQMVGYSKDKILGNSVNLFLDDENFKVVQDQIRRRADGEAGAYELILTAKDGNKLNTLVSPKPLFDLDGKFTGSLSVVTDITNIKNTEFAIKQRISELDALNFLNERLTAKLPIDQMVNAALEGLDKTVGPDFSIIFLRQDGELLPQGFRSRDNAIKDTDIPVHCVGDCICGLAASEKKTLYSLDIHKDPRCVWHECKRAGFRSFVALPLFSGDSVVGILGLASKTQRDFAAQASFLETLASGVAIGLQNSLLYEQAREHVEQLNVANAGLTSEIDERKRAEHETERLIRVLDSKNKELQSVVYTASHDLRSPLVNIQGFGGELATSCKKLEKLLSTKTIPEEIRRKAKPLVSEDIPEALDFINAGTNKMNMLIAGLLQLSRIGTASINIEIVDANKLVENIIDTMTYQIQQHAISLDVETLPPCRADNPQLSQVFANIIDNAIKYRSSQRKCCINISGRVENGISIYSITDNGIGIDPNYQDKVFKIFHRLEPEGSVVGEGLGLTIVSRILSRQNGSITLESEPDKGSTFHIALPTA